MTVADFTPAKWPVLAATNEWATEPRLDVFYVFEGCAGNNHCISVRIGEGFDLSCRQNGGFAALDTNNGHLTGDSFVRFNSKCGDNAFTDRDRRALACEELGHIMGLDHGGDPNDTCMASGPIDQLHHHPRPHDFSMLHDFIYDHND
ncbi:MAG: hypothetical protein WD556_09360 [Actinomycetota bacterium]